MLEKPMQETVEKEILRKVYVTRCGFFYSTLLFMLALCKPNSLGGTNNLERS